MEENLELTVEETSFAKIVGQEFVKSIAVSAGAWGGLLVVGLVYGKILQRKEQKANQTTTA